MLLPYYRDDMMRRPDPAHTLGNEGRAIIDTFTGEAMQPMLSCSQCSADHLTT